MRCCEVALFALVYCFSFLSLATARSLQQAAGLTGYTSPKGTPLKFVASLADKESKCLTLAPGATSGSVQKVGAGSCGPSVLLFVYDPKTTALQVKFPNSQALSGACLTDFGSFSSGKNTPGVLAIAPCEKTIKPSQQWQMIKVSATKNFLRSKSGLCMGVDKAGALATVMCGGTSKELLF